MNSQERERERTYKHKCTDELSHGALLGKNHFGDEVGCHPNDANKANCLHNPSHGEDIVKGGLF
jgi:hypothetical protein